MQAVRAQLPAPQSDDKHCPVKDRALLVINGAVPYPGGHCSVIARTYALSLPAHVRASARTAREPECSTEMPRMSINLSAKILGDSVLNAEEKCTNSAIA